ncbi:WhiB family transcriptional regulator [Mycolicibacterium neoaurum]|uniref:WhiB family transcriptional regulator n=1 Tax=Mycolicibacterium neoaurum TaxID=1795 RepID=UPI0026724DC4|nr:WhiB family transcriptional regulator [Mycolicibacterium neoaurum]MDO3399903.1 WhiB family transcriptional regulator [Mycolicibacterium neoaurum]
MRSGGLQHAAWRTRAKCRGVSLEDFYPGDKESRDARIAREHRAKSICRRCPVVLACREYALENGEAHGVWGATTPAERRSTQAGRINRAWE